MRCLSHYVPNCRYHGDVHKIHLAAACYCFITTTFEVFFFLFFPVSFFFFCFSICRNLGWEISRLWLHQRMSSPASNYPSRISSCYTLYKECWFQSIQTIGPGAHSRLQWASWWVNRSRRVTREFSDVFFGEKLYPSNGVINHAKCVWQILRRRTFAKTDFVPVFRR